MYQPNEAGTLSVKLNILKDTDNKSLDFVDSFFLAHDLQGDFNACCFLEAHGTNQIKVKSKVDSLNFFDTSCVNRRYQNDMRTSIHA